MDRIVFTGKTPVFNELAAWQPTNMKVGGVRVWSHYRGGGLNNLLRVGRYGDQEFVSWSDDRIPNYL